MRFLHGSTQATEGNPQSNCIGPMPHLTAASISMELLQDSLASLEQLTTGITNLAVDATSDPTKAPWVRVLLGEP